jgi:hypothetical protein
MARYRTDLPQRAGDIFLTDAVRYRALRDRMPRLVVLGGCCGTDHHLIAAISAACVEPARSHLRVARRRLRSFRSAPNAVPGQDERAF